MNYYIECWKKYFVFSGRARRAEYWYFVLFNMLVSLGLVIVDAATGTLDENGNGLLSGIYYLAVLIPSLSVAVRRLHDVGRTGWWMLLVFLPVIGVLVILFWLVQPGSLEENEFGVNPIL